MNFEETIKMVDRITVIIHPRLKSWVTWCVGIIIYPWRK